MKLDARRLAMLVGAGVLVLLSQGCSSAGSAGPRQSERGEGSGGGGGPAASAQELGGVCPSCMAGGETGDFGAASTVSLTPCQMSERSSVINEDDARAAGFGPALDVLVRSFSAPLALDAHEDYAGPAPRGYTAETVLDGQTQIARIERLVPQLPNCEDSLKVTLDASLQSRDGAFAATGQLQVRRTSRRGDLHSSAFGMINLATVTGTLRVEPPPQIENASGSLLVFVDFFPDAVRGYLLVRLGLTRRTLDAGSVDAGSVDAGSVDAGSVYDAQTANQGYPEWYVPVSGSLDALEGRFPIDDCGSSSLPVVLLDVPNAALFDRSPNSVLEELEAALGAGSRGRWLDGSETIVTVEVGTPRLACVFDKRAVPKDEMAPVPQEVSYPLSLRIRTSDARVNIDEPASVWARFAKDGSLERATFDITRDEPVPAQSLARAGISGLASDTPYARWHVDIYVFGFPGAELVVQDGDNFWAEIERLDW